MRGWNLNLRRAVISEYDDWNDVKGIECSDIPASLCQAGNVTEQCSDDKPPWKDKDACIVLAIASLLMAYVEDERGGEEGLKEHINWHIGRATDENEDEFSQGVSKNCASYEHRILRLYQWWTEYRPKIQKAADKEMFVHIDDMLLAQDKQFCMEVLAIMDAMWT